MCKISVVSLVMFFLLSFPVIPTVAEQGFSGGEKEKMETIQMKVNFYRLDKIKKERGEYLGFAELKENELSCEVSDPRLERMLTGDFHTTEIAYEKGKEVSRFVTYKVGTPEHLRMVIDNCHDIGCVAEVVEKEKD